jgi:ATP/maltotriose-dependent transcriptional regulator MalT
LLAEAENVDLMVVGYRGLGGFAGLLLGSVSSQLAMHSPRSVIVTRSPKAAGSRSGELLEALPRHETAHAALLADILDVVHGTSLAAKDQSSSPPAEELSPTELRVLRYLPTNLSRPEITSELSVSVNTVNTHVRNIYAKLQARDRSSAVERARELRLLSAGLTR